MQGASKARFLKYHHGSVLAVSFHPKDRYLFCSGGADGSVNLYSCQRYEFLQSYAMDPLTVNRNVNAIKFNCDGERLMVSSNTRRLCVIDISRGDQISHYDNCTFDSRERAGLTTDPQNPNITVSSSVNGKGLVLFDLRMPSPFDYLHGIHGDIIRDVMFIPRNWPWGSSQGTLLTVSEDGICKIVSLDGRCLYTITADKPLKTVAITPEHYNSGTENGFPSLIALGGSKISAYLPKDGISDIYKNENDAPVMKLRYTANGSQLYAAWASGVVVRYRRWPDRHTLLGEVIYHQATVHDLDISPYDEYLVTASGDKSVGIVKLGEPNHGASEYSELT